MPAVVRQNIIAWLSAYFETAAGLQDAMQSPDFGQVLGDIPNYFDGMPDVLIGDVVALPS